MYDRITFKLMDPPRNVDISLSNVHAAEALLDPDGIKAQILKLPRLVLVGSNAN